MNTLVVVWTVYVKSVLSDPVSGAGIIVRADQKSQAHVIDADDNVTEPVDEVRKQFPSCPATCEAEWFGDNWCDGLCALPECGNDGGDCEGWCAPGCRPEWVGDGFCDRTCFSESCGWDNKDCDGLYNTSSVVIAVEGFNYTDCDKRCELMQIGNGICESACFSEECNWDGGDCNAYCNPDCPMQWLKDGECDDECSTPECGFDKGDCPECSEGCRENLNGNGICDVACMNAACQWDMGDCAGICRSFPADYKKRPFEYIQCRNEWIGDGHCDCSCLNKECRFDDDDCKDKFTSSGDPVCLVFENHLNSTYNLTSGYSAS